MRRACVVLAFLIGSPAWGGDFDICPQNDPSRNSFRRGSAESEFCLGFAHATGRGVATDTAMAIRHYRNAAEQGYARAQATLGLHFDQGIGVGLDPAEALKWYKEAAAQGHAGAMNNLGEIYRHGKGVPANAAEARKWYEMAVQRDSPEARRALEAMSSQANSTPSHASSSLPAQQLFEEGERLYVAGNIRASVQPFMQAAEAGNHLAQLQIGNMYENGEGLPRNDAEAVKWYSKSANQGNAAAQSNLGNMYEDGLGVADDWVEAAMWMRKSAEQGHTAGQFRLGRAYQYGIGVPLNLQTAIDWFDRAAAKGHSQADYFARYLRDNHGLDPGFRTDEEERMLGPLIGRSVLTPPPIGTTFHNAAERMTYIRWQASNEACQKARMRHAGDEAAHERCRSAGRSDCGAPPGPPPC